MKRLTLITNAIFAFSLAVTSPANAKNNDHKHSNSTHQKQRHIEHKKQIRYIQHKHQSFNKQKRKPSVTIIKVAPFSPILKLLLLPNNRQHHAHY